jgi:hypothetical protein
MGTINRSTAIRDACAAREEDAWKTREDVRSVSLRLDNEQYIRLRRFVTSHEDQTGRRITVLEIALAEYLGAEGSRAALVVLSRNRAASASG